MLALAWYGDHYAENARALQDQASRRGINLRSPEALSIGGMSVTDFE